MICKRGFFYYPFNLQQWLAGEKNRLGVARRIIGFWLVVGLAVGSAAPAAQPVTSALSSIASSSSADDIRDIRGPVHVADFSDWLLYGVAFLILVAALFGLWYWFKNRKKISALTAHELALEKLEEARKLLTPDTVREYSFAVSEIVRNYLEARFSVGVTHQTTEEFLRELVIRPDSPLSHHTELLQDFLRSCDMVKFGRYFLTKAEMEKMHENVRNFILETRPLPETEEKAKTVAAVSPAATPVVAAKTAGFPSRL